MHRLNIGVVIFLLMQVGTCSQEVLCQPDMGHRGHMSSSHGMSGFVPTFLAEILMIPSLTKAQQEKIRNLYLIYRPKSLEKMALLAKLRHGGRYGGRERSMSGDRGDEEGTGGKAHGHSKGKSGKPKTKEEETESLMQGSEANLRRTVFTEMMQEYQEFEKKVLAVLNEKQKKELREIGKKSGSPDFFTNRHYDIMNTDRMGGPGRNRPD